jgi:Rieske 2Fe-2S family protein
MGARTLDGKYFTSPEVYEQETQNIFRKEWICVGRASEIPTTGDFLVREFDGESLIIVRDENGKVGCFYNVCRHRGTRITEETCGHFKRHIQCPYHAWTYGLDGSLKGAPNMMEVEAFNTDEFPLMSVPCATWQGFILINLDQDCPPFEAVFEPIHARFDDWGMDKLVSAHQVLYDIEANWKIIFQNYSECYHCTKVHPQLTPATSVRSSSNDFEDGQFLGGPMILSDSYKTMSMDGELCGEVLPGLSDADQERTYFYTIFPSLFISPHPDYVLIHRIERLGIGSTRVVCDWLFPESVIARKDFDPVKAAEFWDITNRQDWHVCELTYKGVSSDAYRPGPYSNLESILAAFDRHYMETMK